MKLKLLFTLIIISTISLSVSAQVGINTIEPKADLEIVSDAAPGVNKYNGVIIPKVTVLPVSTDLEFPTSDQAGLLLYLNSATAADNGVYLFDGTQYVKLEPANASGAFYDNGTTDFATTTTGDIERLGKVSIGSSIDDGILNVEVNSTADINDRTTIKGINNSRSAANQSTIVVDIENTSETTGEKIGLKSRVDGLGSGTHTGIALDTEVTDGAGVTTNYGLRSTVGSTSNATSTGYGLYSKIGTAGARGTNYAVYAYSQHADVTSGSTDVLGSYSGYFRGDNFAIRSENDLDGYRMPTISGTNGQVLTTNGTDTATWSDLPAMTEVDGSITNEGSLTVIAGGINDAEIQSNTNSSTNVTIAGGNGISISESGSTISISNTYRPTVTNVYNQNDGIGNGQVSGGNSTTVISSLNIFEPIINYSYVPLYANSTIVIEADFDYDIDNGARGTDGFRSNIEVNDIEIAQKRQRFTDAGASGGGNRSSNLTPIMGKYLNTATTALNLEINLERWFGDDPIKAEFHRLIKITEIPN